MRCLALILRKSVSVRQRTAHGVEACLSLFAYARENHRNMVAGVFVAGTIHHHAGTIDLASILRRLDRHRHRDPLGKSCLGSEFNSTFADYDGFRGKNEICLPRRNGDALFRRADALNFSCAHDLLPRQRSIQT